MDRMVIGYLVPEFPGQTHNFFWREIEQLRIAGIEVVLLSTKRPLSEPNGTNWRQQASRMTTYLHPMGLAEFVSLLPALARGVAGNLRAVIEILRDAARLGPGRLLKTALFFPFSAKLARACREAGASLVHVHSCADALSIAMIARRVFGLRYGMTLHNPLWVYGPGQPLKWQHSSYAVVITRALQAAVLQELGSAVPRTLGVAPMGVDCETFRRTNAFMPYDGVGPFRVVCCARLNAGKGHLELLSAIGRLRDDGIDVSLSIAGEDDLGGRGFRKKVEAHIVELGLQERVRLLGALSESAIIDLLSHAHVFALASHDEPLGVAIMEAMAMELPVVVARSDGVRERVDDGVHGLLFEPLDVDALAAALEQISRSPERARDFGTRGRERVLQHFSTARSAQLIRTILDRGTD